ncbi:hypothetical protein M408DRAFT_329336 [Serendipita vermifera MAFF 305830]|uniref:Uncharacterized protein n=1 Tax=Serendipita vermifera MAFF 305830 TaxID=933852 RepID=A0A0C2XHH7_SERVB|nr:hypothetical protein M408DRAFT_329336 [Serendipita vermifera MAFF 305830]
MYGDVKALTAFEEYCEALGITSVGDLKRGTGSPPDDPQIRVAASKPLLIETSADFAPRPTLSSPSSSSMTGSFEEFTPDYEHSPAPLPPPTPLNEDPALAAAFNTNVPNQGPPADTDTVHMNPPASNLNTDAMEVSADALLTDSYPMFPALGIFPGNPPASLLNASLTSPPMILSRIIVLENVVGNLKEIINDLVAVRSASSPAAYGSLLSPHSNQSPLANRISGLHERHVLRDALQISTRTRRRARRKGKRAENGEIVTDSERVDHHLPGQHRAPAARRTSRHGSTRRPGRRFSPRPIRSPSWLERASDLLKSLRERLEGVCNAPSSRARYIHNGRHRSSRRLATPYQPRRNLMGSLPTLLIILATAVVLFLLSVSYGY